MKIHIRGIYDHGNNDERIILDVNTDTDIGDFLILDSTFTARGRASNKVRHPYWFPDKIVKKGDTVVLYTKRGENKTRLNEDNTYSHFFYWELEYNIWNNTGDCAVLLHIADWSSYPAK
ncbi:hypothetical protein [Flavobacterium sp. WV_118_3]|jgi:hypothetical protein|uniref:hypothetical protein n=1 Tax=Flavobacterium sp. WV_118_3 TaxID=3151764 RepID=UPI0012CAC09F|nr:hypothetical protein [Flavobacterium sp.]HRB72382.1 hypothetical protein [Flavobacterium sp.]